MPRFWWLTATVLVALGLVMGGAHVLELPVRAAWDAAFYMRVTSTMYRYFGMIGGPVQVLALLVTFGLLWRSRGRPGFRYVLAGAACLVLSLVLWFVIVQAVNAAWADALRAGEAEAVRAYDALRGRWEAGHVAAFVAWLAGFVLLVLGLIREAAWGAAS